MALSILGQRFASHCGYDQYSQEQESSPFEEVKDQLEAEFLHQRQNEVVQDFIQELRAESTVEVLL